MALYKCVTGSISYNHQHWLKKKKKTHISLPNCISGCSYLLVCKCVELMWSCITPIRTRWQFQPQPSLANINKHKQHFFTKLYETHKNLPHLCQTYTEDKCIWENNNQEKCSGVRIFSAVGLQDTKAYNALNHVLKHPARVSSQLSSGCRNLHIYFFLAELSFFKALMVGLSIKTCNCGHNGPCGV